MSKPLKSNARVQILAPKTPAQSLAPEIAGLLAKLGEDPHREGLIRTPERVDKALKFLTSGYSVDIDRLMNNAVFAVQYDEMVIVKDIEFFSLCEHHMLPFFGRFTWAIWRGIK